MNLFRSEEHVGNWSGCKPGTEAGILPLPAIAQLFSGNLFTKRRMPDYASQMKSYLEEFVSVLNTKGPFWQLPGT